MKSRPAYGIDVGTTKIVAVSGRVDSEGFAEVTSVGEAPSHGLKRGVIVDRTRARESVAAAIEACGRPEGSVCVGVAGSHISSFNIGASLLNSGRNLKVTEKFIRRLEEEARRVEVDEDEQVIHVIPRSFSLDGNEGVRHPVGLAARRVTMRAHVVSGAVSSIQNLLEAVEECGVTVSRVVLEPLASAEAIFSDEDRAGSALVDIGGGTTDIAAFSRGVLAHTAVVPLGGESLSSDVAYGLKVPFETAESLKRRYGTVLPDTVDPVAAAGIEDRHYNARFVSQILEYRAREILEFARDSLIEARVASRLSGAVVLTGGGSLLDGMPELAEDIIGLPARVAAPHRLEGESKPLQKPQYSTAIGLLHFAAENYERESKGKGASAASFGSIVSAIKSWFRG
ncbi:MAG: cell division protein FtsA [Rubrobacter sp.]|nr:cell division protein FtsA [Rubrobacter sp.]